MKRFLLIALLLSAVAAFPKEKNPADYAVAVHVLSSHSASEYSGQMPIRNTTTGQVYGSIPMHDRHLVLTATIDSHKYELRSTGEVRGLLPPGEYQAKLIDGRRSRFYELLLPTGKSIKFEVVGTSE